MFALLILVELLNIYQSFDDEEIAVFPRKRRTIEPMVCLRCDTDDSGLWTHGGSTDCLDFTTNLDCIIVGIKVFGSNTYSGEHDISFNILKSSEVLRSIETVLYSEKGQEMYPVMFEKPLDVKKNTRYTLKLNMKGPEAFSGESYKMIASLNVTDSSFKDAIIL